jgi:hypothetical protein
VNPVLAGVAVAVLAGAILAVSARDARLAVLGIAPVLVLSPLLADPFPTAQALVGRMAGALLAAYLLWIVVRAGGWTGGSRIGWPAELTLTAAAVVAGAMSHGAATAPVGPLEAQAAGFGLAVLAIGPLTTGRDLIRVGIGLLLLVHAALLVRVAVAGAPTDLEHLGTAFLVAAVGGSVAALAHAARSDPAHVDGRDGGFDLAGDERFPRRRTARATVEQPPTP